jgi:hypothetical protein
MGDHSRPLRQRWFISDSDYRRKSTSKPVCQSGGPSVSSRRLAPSGVLPVGEVPDCTTMRRSGGDGGGPDRVFTFPSKVLSAECMDFFCNVFLFILEFRLVIVSPPRSVFLVCIRSEKEKEGKLLAKARRS